MPDGKVDTRIVYFFKLSPQPFDMTVNRPVVHINVRGKGTAAEPYAVSSYNDLVKFATMINGGNEYSSPFAV